MSQTQVRRFQVIGWLLFILSALLFTWTTALAGDWIGVAASILFLIACIVFLAPVLRGEEAAEATIREGKRS